MKLAWDARSLSHEAVLVASPQHALSRFRPLSASWGVSEASAEATWLRRWCVQGAAGAQGGLRSQEVGLRPPELWLDKAPPLLPC